MRWGMAIDLKRCIGCNTCVLACKAENGTPPGVFWMRVAEVEDGHFPTARRTFIPLRCNHCASPPCVPVCPTGATYSRQHDGLVMLDYEKCIGCGACVVACPYQARSLTHADEPYFEQGLTPFEAHHPRRAPARVAQKCTFCVHRLDQGLETACAQSCPTCAILVGDLDDPGGELARALRARQWVRPRADLGTDPSLYYLLDTDLRDDEKEGVSLDGRGVLAGVAEPERVVLAGRS
jgi:Fe-S-cluster-containing dehydrogenase component